MEKELKKSVRVSEPTFLSPLDLHFRMSSSDRRQYIISELKQLKENVLNDGSLYTAKKTK